MTKTTLVAAEHAPVLAVGEELIEGHALLASAISIFAADYTPSTVICVVIGNCVSRDVLPTGLAANNSFRTRLHLVFFDAVCAIDVSAPESTRNGQCQGIFPSKLIVPLLYPILRSLEQRHGLVEIMTSSPFQSSLFINILMQHKLFVGFHPVSLHVPLLQLVKFLLRQVESSVKRNLKVVLKEDCDALGRSIVGCMLEWRLVLKTRCRRSIHLACNKGGDDVLVSTDASPRQRSVSAPIFAIFLCPRRQQLR